MQINLVRSVILHTSCQAKVQPLTIVICGVYNAFLGEVLDSTKLAVNLGKVVDNLLLLLLKTLKSGMNRLLRIIPRFCMDMHMKPATFQDIYTN